MDVREKMVEILKQAPFEGKVLDEWWWEEKIKRIADHLITNGVTVQEWVSVEDELPEKKGSFLVYVKTRNKWGGYIKTAWFTPCYEGVENHMQGKKIWYDYDSEYGDYEVRDVTHWMPMPELPKGE